MKVKYVEGEGGALALLLLDRDADQDFNPVQSDLMLSRICQDLSG